MTTRRLAAAVLTVAALALAGAPAALPAAAQQAPQDAGTTVQADVVLPPGNSQFYSIDATATALPVAQSGQGVGDWGPNTDDQRELYWTYQFRDGGLRPEPFCDEPQTPRDGVTVCFDEYGVPVSYGDTVEDVWYGIGYAVAQQHLFLVDAARRTQRGTLSEIAGPGSVPADVQARVLDYTDAEYEAMLDRQDPDSRAAIDGYVGGFNAWIETITTTRPDLLPAEYALLQITPEPLTEIDVAAIGVLLVRSVAVEGGNEMRNVRALRALEEQFGTAAGRAIFRDLVWQEDAEATVTVPREEGVFPRTSATADERLAAFEAMADYAATIPLELTEGLGTGAYETPDSGVPVIPGVDEDERSTQALAAADVVARAAEGIAALPDKLHGGSFLVAISPDRTADGSALLVSEPQLLMNPQLLFEIEVHGAGFDARGATAPGVPVVGIGYTDTHGWALTTGNAKTIDSFIETTRPDSDGDGALEYLHDGQWTNADCRTETVAWRDTIEDVPVGPATNSDEIEVCRTVHGPIVAQTEDQTMARSVQYAVWQREVDTIQGVLEWPRANSLAEFTELMSKVTWNENLGYADAEGNIAYWHPGLHHVRDPRTDLRLPIPGTGEYDHGGFLAFEDLPHVVNPDQGFVANWNNKPAHGWLDGGGDSITSYPAGRGHRVTTVMDQLAARDDWTFEALRELDRVAGSRDHRARDFMPLVLQLAELDDLTARERQALDLLAAWDWSANGPGADFEFDFEGTPATIGAAPTIFHELMADLVDEVLGDIRLETFDLVAAQSDQGRHFYEMSAALNLVLRVLDPAVSSLTPSRDYAGGRTSTQVLRDTLNVTLDRLEAELGGDLASWRSAYGSMERVCSPTGVIGPCVEMPFLERGSWIHLVGYAGAASVEPVPDEPEVDDTEEPLPTTGGSAAVTLAGLLALVGVSLRRRRT